MKRLVIDIDGTLAMAKAPDGCYGDVGVRPEVLAALRRYRAQGFSIILHSSRGMRTYQGSVGHLNARVLPVLLEWLRRNDVPFDEIHIGKPWCGEDGFYVDDRAVRPSEFAGQSYESICAMLEHEAAVGARSARSPAPVREDAGPEPAGMSEQPVAERHRR